MFAVASVQSLKRHFIARPLLRGFMYQFETFVITATSSVVLFCYLALKYPDGLLTTRIIAVCALIVAIGLFFWIFFTPSGRTFARNQNRKQQKTVVDESQLFAEGESLLRNIHFNYLMDKFRKLSTFAEVAEWDKEAEATITKIVEAIKILDTVVLQHNNVNIFTQIKFKKKYQEILENMAEKLQESIDFTPKNSDEKKTLLKELSHAKKELELQKREVTATMKNLNQESRSKSVRAGTYLWMYNSKLAAKERRKIRYQRDAELKPNEATKSAIERQILQIDKDILSIKFFTE